MNRFNKHLKWVLIRHYSEQFPQGFPIWVSYYTMNEKTFSPATEYEEERFGFRIHKSQIIAFEEQVTDRSTAFWTALWQIQKEQKESQNYRYINNHYPTHSCTVSQCKNLKIS